MKTFSDSTKEAIYNSQNGFCGVDSCLNRIHSFHHIVRNIKYLQDKLPLFLHSPINCIGVCEQHHNEWTQHRELNCISEAKAKVIERYLEDIINFNL